jgi:hypothetical protein
MAKAPHIGAMRCLRVAPAELEQQRLLCVHLWRRASAGLRLSIHCNKS